MKGDKVIVRAHGDVPLVRRVWEVTPEIVFICSEENFKILTSGEDGLWPVGFPREYVYRYNPKIDLNRVSWENLTTYEKEEKKTTSEKPVSLSPLGVEEALAALLKVKTKPPKETPKPKKKKKPSG